MARLLVLLVCAMLACCAQKLAWVLQPASRAPVQAPLRTLGSNPAAFTGQLPESEGEETPLVVMGSFAAAATAMGMAAQRRRARGFTGRQPGRTLLAADAGGMALVKGPKETYMMMVDKGEANSKMSVVKTFMASALGGAYVGMAGLLSLAISGNMGATSQSAQKFVFAALFPVNLLLVLQSGCQLFTGNTATMTMGVIEGRCKLGSLLRNWLVSYIGNIVGCGMLAFTAHYTGLLSMGTADLAVATVLKKCSGGFGPVLVKAIMCNWLVCMAVFLATSANDLTGKMVGIWFPISMFVAIGFEHSVANMFLLPTGLLAGAPLSVWDTIVKNLIPVTLGNLIAGTVVIAGGLSFMHGKLGKDI